MLRTAPLDLDCLAHHEHIFGNARGTHDGRDFGATATLSSTGGEMGKDGDDNPVIPATRTEMTNGRSICGRSCVTAVEAVTARIRNCSRMANKVMSCNCFDQAVVGLILVNCVFLAFDDPTEEVRLASTLGESQIHAP